MKATRAAIIVSLCLLLICLTAQAQTPNTKHFDKDSLSFDYPNGWTVEDKSTTDAQQLTLIRSENEAQISLFVHRGKVDTPEKLAQAKSAFIDPYIKSTNNSFVQMGVKTTQTSASTEVAGAQAEGVRISAVLDGEPGEAAIYWLTVGNRVVVLTILGSEKAIKQATPAWDAIRNSLHIEAAKPQQKPTPK